jgi:hypothetical protein
MKINSLVTTDWLWSCWSNFNGNFGKENSTDILLGRGGKLQKGSGVKCGKEPLH